MRLSMESILYEYGVDIVLNGHLHSYERVHPVFNNTLNDCAPSYFTLGDGGNYEYTNPQWLFFNSQGFWKNECQGIAICSES